MTEAIASRLLREGLVPLARLAAMLPPRRGRAPRPDRLLREVRAGKLEAVYDGTRWLSSAGALARWLAGTTPRPETPTDDAFRREAAEAREAFRRAR